MDPFDDNIENCMMNAIGLEYQRRIPIIIRRLEMEKWINMVEMHVTDPSREKEVNDWFQNIHLPDLLKTPGFVSAKRYVMKEPRNGRGKFVAIYEIETDDIEKTLELRKQYMAKEHELGRSPDKMIPGLMLPIWQWVVCKQIQALPTDK